MTRRARVTPNSHPPRHILDRAADGDRHATDYQGKPMPSVRTLLIIKPDGRTVWDVDALLGEPQAPPKRRRRRGLVLAPDPAASPVGERAATQEGGQ